MRRRFSLRPVGSFIYALIAAVFGVPVLLSYFVDSDSLRAFRFVFVQWTLILGAFALLLGALNVFSVHVQRIRRRQGIGYSLILITAMLVVIVLVAELVGPVNELLNRVVLRSSVPELTTARGWVVPAGTTKGISLFGHAGALLLYASLLSYALFRWRGAYRPGVARRILRDVVRRAVPSSLGIAAMVGMAVTMDHAGMTHLLAEGIGRAVGPAFPWVAPFIGALGAFMTGSNTNSNVVFGALQERVAALVGMEPLWALAAQTAGGAIGGMFAPAKVIVGCAPVGADEGATMRKTLVYGVVILAGVAALTWAMSRPPL